MITLRRGDDRGRTRIGWLDGRHTFSFGDFYDPAFHHFRTLRVINDDRVAVGGGFPTHPHRDMEILTYVLSGELEHRDSMGNGEVIRAGEWQRMTAGSGITHSEFNPSATTPTHLLQIWIMPERKGLTPSYEQRVIAPGENAWRPVASRDGRDGSMAIHQDATVSTARLSAGKPLTYEFAANRGGWLHVIAGTVTANGHSLTAGDAIGLESEPVLNLTGPSDSELLLFDMA
jgi:redox-sensitive bicupin YhaK (pirin superfamily)